MGTTQSFHIELGEKEEGEGHISSSGPECPRRAPPTCSLPGAQAQRADEP